MSSELDKARAALEQFTAETRKILSDRILGKRKSAPMNRVLPDGAMHLRVALAEVDRLTAALAEAEATLANERGEGDPPTPGWKYDAGEWVHPDATVSPVVATALGGSVRRRWEWGTADKAGQRDTARAAMRAATLKETP